jgi:hypothetical protein
VGNGQVTAPSSSVPLGPSRLVWVSTRVSTVPGAPTGAAPNPATTRPARGSYATAATVSLGPSVASAGRWAGGTGIGLVNLTLGQAATVALIGTEEDLLRLAAEVLTAADRASAGGGHPSG